MNPALTKPRVPGLQDCASTHHIMIEMKPAGVAPFNLSTYNNSVSGQKANRETLVIFDSLCLQYPLNNGAYI